MTEYEIQPLSLICARSGRELKPGERYFSVLSESPQGFVRLDYAAEAWSDPPEGAIAFWRSTVPQPSAENRPPPVDTTAVMEFFEKLAGDEDPTKLNFRYILALLLLRKRLLKFATVEREGERETLVLRSSATREEHRVVNPGLSEEQLAAVQREVDRILRGPAG